MGYTLRELVDKVPPQTENKVRYVKRTFTRNIHNILRQETGLRLSVQTNEELGPVRKGISVPVRILPGIPEELEDLEFPEDQTLPLTLAPWRRHLTNVINSGTALVEGLFPLLDEMEEALSEVNESLLKDKNEFYPPTIELARQLLDIANKSRLIPILFSREQTYLTDYLGVYRYNWDRRQTSGPSNEQVTASIELYWGVIGLCAANLNISVEGLALKVLAHEWGHAYSHIGADIDGKRWPSKGFSTSDRSIKEGLAQYCALKVLEELRWRFPDGLQAYEAIVPQQPEIYRTHQGWEDYSSEEIRDAMLTARRVGVANHDDFHSSLNDAKKRLNRQS